MGNFQVVTNCAPISWMAIRTKASSHCSDHSTKCQKIEIATNSNACTDQDDVDCCLNKGDTTGQLNVLIGINSEICT